MNALNYLSEAKGWSILDILSSGFLSFIADFMEYSKFNRAKDEIRKASIILNRIRNDLKYYLDEIPNINSTLMWMIIDIGLDNFIFDLFRHFRIKECRDKIQSLINDIDNIIMWINSRRG